MSAEPRGDFPTPGSASATRERRDSDDHERGQAQAGDGGPARITALNCAGLDTARFSALYGHWHPNARSETAFWRALLNQIDAVRLALQAIRAVNPLVRLIQTEDFGVTYGTDPCAEQVRHESLRRLATWDLLSGRVTPSHGLHARISAHGFHGRLAAIAADPCPADVIGLNHYATSNRFLDHRLERYPPDRHGGNGRLRYADLEAVRVLDDEERGWGLLFDRLSDRYGSCIAVTECHLGCSVRAVVRLLKSLKSRML